MNIAIGQGMERFKLFDPIDLKPDVRVGIDRSTGGATQIDDLIAFFSYSVQLYPDNMMLDRVGMVGFMAHYYPYYVMVHLTSLINFQVRNVLLLSLIQRCLDNL